MVRSKFFEDAIDHVAGERGRMGAYQKRLEHAYQSQAVTSENLTEAESRIRDTDMAEEVVNYTKTVFFCRHLSPWCLLPIRFRRTL